MINDSGELETRQGDKEHALGESLAFPPLDDLLNQLRQLAQAQPDRMALFVYGQSCAGEPLLALRIGEGPRRILAYAFPQPDEPLGGLVILQLVRRLLQEAALCQGATWTLLPCVDPDGARRNEGWFTQPLELAAYAGRHFRPPEGEQVEWSFPSSDPAWPWESVLPEARALQALIDEERPQSLFPLHNALLGGAYAFVSPEAASLGPSLAGVWEALGLPTHRGEAELPFAQVIGTGVFRLPDLGEMAAALARQGIVDPASLLACGASPYLYGRRYGQVLTIVPELPLFVVPGIADDRPGGLSCGEVLGESLAADRAAWAGWSALYARAAPFLREDNPYRSALESHRRATPIFLQATAAWLASDRGLQRPASVAEVVDGLHATAYWRLLPLGLLRQAIAAEEGVGRLARVAAEVSGCLEKGLAGVLPVLQATPASLESLVQAAGAILEMAVGLPSQEIPS